MFHCASDNAIDSILCCEILLQIVPNSNKRVQKVHEQIANFPSNFGSLYVDMNGLILINGDIHTPAVVLL